MTGLVLAALAVVAVLLAAVIVLLVRAIPERVVGALSTDDTFRELHAAVGDLTAEIRTARATADRIDRATQEEP